MSRKVNGEWQVKGRGFQQRGRGSRATWKPAGGVRRPGTKLAGAPGIEGLLRAAQKDQTRHLYPPPPVWWTAPLEEWIVYWYLKDKLHWQENHDFYYQGRVFLPGFYQSKNFTQADFIVDLGPTAADGIIGSYQAIVLDPFTEFTHDYGLDIARKQALDQEGYLLVFLAQHDLEQRTDYVMREALRGIDLSNRNPGL